MEPQEPPQLKDMRERLGEIQRLLSDMQRRMESLEQRIFSDGGSDSG